MNAQEDHLCFIKFKQPHHTIYNRKNTGPFLESRLKRRGMRQDNGWYKKSKKHAKTVLTNEVGYGSLTKLSARAA
ncbi:hypothetical protein, partial [Oscillibacter sp.]|uniref:hypothetical protein n=1 Tax=Oscillibacter sp. TaxID=1945593 RepID=UPI0028AF3F34